jgi:hypothetical protein
VVINGFFVYKILKLAYKIFCILKFPVHHSVNKQTNKRRALYYIQPLKQARKKGADILL